MYAPDCDLQMIYARRRRSPWLRAFYVCAFAAAMLAVGMVL